MSIRGIDRPLASRGANSGCDVSFHDPAPLRMLSLPRAALHGSGGLTPDPLTCGCEWSAPVGDSKGVRVVLIALAALHVAACCGPRESTTAVQKARVDRFEPFRDAARFSLASTQSWWLLTSQDDLGQTGGARRILCCGANFKTPEGDSRVGQFEVVCIWDYENRSPPVESQLEQLSVPSSLGAAPWLGQSLLGAIGLLRHIKFWKVIDNRFVVGADSEATLSLAIERRGHASFLGSAVLPEIPDGARELVLNEADPAGAWVAAYLPADRVLLIGEPDRLSHSMATRLVPIAVGNEEFAEGRVLPSGWFEYQIPDAANPEYVSLKIGLEMLSCWGCKVYL